MGCSPCARRRKEFAKQQAKRKALLEQGKAAQPIVQPKVVKTVNPGALNTASDKCKSTLRMTAKGWVRICALCSTVSEPEAVPERVTIKCLKETK